MIIRDKIDVYIFLDVDGVLNCETDWKKPFSLNLSCLKVLSEINKWLTKRYKPHYILTSTWRIGKSEKSNSPQYTHLTFALESVGISISDVTPSGNNKDRQDEIEYYAKRHNIDRYIIIDDDEKLFHGSNRLYLTDYKKGLNENDVKAIKRLIKRFCVKGDI